MKHTTSAGWLRSGPRLQVWFYDGTRKLDSVLTMELTRDRACCGFDRKRSDWLEVSPDIRQFEDKVGNRTLTDETLRIAKLLRFTVGTINVGSTMIGIEQPTKLSTIGNPL